MKFKKSLKAFMVAAPGVILSNAVLAADYTAAITTAETEGKANVTAVVLAVLGIATLSFGATALLRWLNK